MADRVNVNWTDDALDDLDATAEFIARDSPRYADALVRRVHEAARSLATFSERGRRVPEIRDDAVRELFVSRYRLIYEIRSSAVYVLAFVHGARDLEHLWQRDPRRAPEGDG